MVPLKKNINIFTINKNSYNWDHLENYFCEIDITLLNSSEEVVESMHQSRYKHLMKGLYVKHITNPNIVKTNRPYTKKKYIQFRH